MVVQGHSMSELGNDWIAILHGPVLLLADDLRPAWLGLEQQEGVPWAPGTVTAVAVGDRAGLLLGCTVGMAGIIAASSQECYLVLTVQRPDRRIDPSLLAELRGWRRHAMALHLRRPPLLLTDARATETWQPLPLAANSYELWSATSPEFGVVHHLRPLRGVIEAVAALQANEEREALPLPRSGTAQRR